MRWLLQVGGSYDPNGIGVRATFHDLRLWRVELGAEQVRHAMDLMELQYTVIPHPSRQLGWLGGVQVTASAGQVSATTETLSLGWTRGAYSSERFAHWSYTGNWTGVRLPKEGVQGVQFRCSGPDSSRTCRSRPCVYEWEDSDESLGVGLHADNPPADFNCSKLHFALICRHGVLVISESGVERGLHMVGSMRLVTGTFGDYQSVDLLQLRVKQLVNQEGLVEYVQDDNVLYTSSVSVGYPLGVVVAFHDPSGGIEDVEWIGPSFPRSDWHYQLDSSLSCNECVTSPTVSWEGGHARWSTELKPTGAQPRPPCA